ncbi:MAG: hypothetical protein CVU38_16435 [Chloroflexi bacterium HGW-Chloroflexi-1]|nr:MAG: hypothetical protein CVU38_16435 [Chloroflexi bacterium HGW-Chloroflexi-1]
MPGFGVGVLVAVGVLLAVGVMVGVWVLVGVSVMVGVSVRVGVAVTVAVLLGVDVGVLVGDGLITTEPSMREPSTEPPPSCCTSVSLGLNVKVVVPVFCLARIVSVATVNVGGMACPGPACAVAIIQIRPAAKSLFCSNPVRRTSPRATEMHSR